MAAKHASAASIGARADWGGAHPGRVEYGYTRAAMRLRGHRASSCDRTRAFSCRVGKCSR